MKIFLDESEMLELSADYLDLSQPNADMAHEIALKMDMVYDALNIVSHNEKIYQS